MSTRFPSCNLEIGSFLLLLCALHAAACPATSAVGTAASTAFSVSNSDVSSIELRFVLPPLSSETVQAGGADYAKVDLAGYGTSSEQGSPRLPVPRCLIQVPLDARCEVVVTDLESRERPLETPVLPLQPPRWGDGPEPSFEIDPVAYATQGFGDGPIATLDEVGLFRGNRLLLLSLRAVQYDPQRQCLKAIDRAAIRINMIGGDTERTRALARRYQSPVFDQILNRLVLNRPAPNGAEISYVPGNPVGLLIISAPAFHDDPMMRDFVAWKERKGLIVTHVSTEQTGATKEEIRSYIQQAYFGWPIPPSLVMLVGDTPEIPNWNSETTPTDLYYATPFDDTYIPDLALGRVSVADTTQLHSYLSKVLSYEKADWTGNDGWEKHVAFLAAETTWYQFEGQQEAVIGPYLVPAGYEIDRLYCHSYHATSQQVLDAVDAGRSQVTFAGHSGWWCWGDGPGFTQDQVRRLQNVVYPFVQAYTCESGQYTRPECFGETWIRTPHGAIGYWGASDVVATLCDPTMEYKFYEGMYNSFDGINQTWLGGMALYAKLGYYSYYGEEWMSQDFLEKYNLLADPSIDLWMDVPSTLDVDVAEVLLEGARSMEVDVAGLRNGMVTVRKEDGADSLFVTAWTDSVGHAVVFFPDTIHGGMLHLAVTAHDRIPWFADLRVISPTGPTLEAGASYILDPEGDGDGRVDAGELADLRVTLRNIGFAPAGHVVGTLYSDDPLVEIINNRQDYGTIAVGDSTINEVRFKVHVAGAAPDRHPIRLILSVTSDEGIWSCPLSIEVEAPTLKICGELIDDAPPRGNGNGMGDPGEVVYLILQLENRGHSDCGSLAGMLSGSGLRVLDGGADCTGPRVGEQVMMGSFRLEIPSDMPSPGPVPCELSVLGRNGFQASLPYDLILGSFVDDFEIDRGWEIGAPGDDAYFGVWDRAVPIGSWVGEEPAQPDSDHSPGPGTICFVTGNAAPGDDPRLRDVDGGKTTLISPALRLADATSATIGYWRWFTNDLGNNGGQDSWDVEASADGTNWVSLEHTFESANRWVHREFDLEDYIPLTDQVRVRFIVHDDPPDALVEAAIDDFSLTMVRRLRPELYRSGFVSLQPNPTRSLSRIAYRTATPSAVHLSLHDISGRLIRRLVDGHVGPGAHVANFDGRDEEGNRLSSGIYFLRLETPEKTEGTRLIVIR